MTLPTIAAALVAALVAGLFMIAGHYLVPVVMGREMRPPWTYIWGVALGIIGPFAGVLFAAPDIEPLTTLLVLIVVVIGAGGGTIICYLADWWRGYRAERRRIHGKRSAPADPRA